MSRDYYGTYDWLFNEGYTREPEYPNPQEGDTMGIYSKHGTKVIFAYPTNGLDADQSIAAERLKVGETYTVDYTVVHSWFTDVYLKEFPGVAFNSVMFADV